MKRFKKGFTLPELLGVVAIIAVIAAVAVTFIGGAMGMFGGQENSVRALNMTTAMETYNITKTGSLEGYKNISDDKEVLWGMTEYGVLKARSEKGGGYAGSGIIIEGDEQDLYRQIRTEACIALKAYSDEAVSKDYFVKKPSGKDNAVVYYYLTGEVKVMSKEIAESKTMTAAEYYTNDPEYFWVYLSEEGGSGMLILDEEEQARALNIYVKVINSLTKEPVNNATVTLLETNRTAPTGNGNEGIAHLTVRENGTYTVSASAMNYTTNSKSLTINAENWQTYKGCTITNPIIIELSEIADLNDDKCNGNLTFWQEKLTWNPNLGLWEKQLIELTSDDMVTVTFDGRQSTSGSYSYQCDISQSNIFKLRTAHTPLPIGAYTLSASLDGYKDVTADVYAYSNGVVQSGALEPKQIVEYKIVFSMREAYFEGTISPEHCNQPNETAPMYPPDTAEYPIVGTYPERPLTCIQLIQNNEVIYEVEVENNKFKFDGIATGTYKFRIDYDYGYVVSDKLPDTITFDGELFVLNGKTEPANKQNVDSVTFSASHGYFDANNNFIETYTMDGVEVVLERLVDTTTGEYPDPSDPTFEYTSITDENGQVKFTNVKSGYYFVKFISEKLTNFSGKCYANRNNTTAIPPYVDSSDCYGFNVFIGPEGDKSFELSTICESTIFWQDVCSEAGPAYNPNLNGEDYHYKFCRDTRCLRVMETEAHSHNDSWTVLDGTYHVASCKCTHKFTEQHSMSFVGRYVTTTTGTRTDDEGNKYAYTKETGTETYRCTKCSYTYTKPVSSYSETLIEDKPDPDPVPEDTPTKNPEILTPAPHTCSFQNYCPYVHSTYWSSMQTCSFNNTPHIWQSGYMHRMCEYSDCSKTTSDYWCLDHWIQSNHGAEGVCPYPSQTSSWLGTTYVSDWNADPSRWH